MAGLAEGTRDLVLKLLRHLLPGTPRVPPYLIHFLTSRCNARCPHCFIFGENDPRFSGPEMTTEEIRAMTRLLPGGLYNVSLTGGEIFIRPDVEEIGEAYVSDTDVNVIQFFTNGTFPDRAYDCVEGLSRRHPGRNFVLCLSIDDLEGDHDSYRRLNRAFASSMELYRRVQGLKRRNLGLDVGVTVSAANQDRLEDLYRVLVAEHGVRTISAALVRDEPLDPSVKSVDLAKYERFGRLLEDGMLRGELDGFSGFPGADLVNAKSLLMRELMPRAARGEYLSPCHAGRLVGVIHSNGDVAPCEILKTRLGNLRERGFSLPDIWTSRAAAEARSWIRGTKCRCTHECFLAMNLVFNGRHLPGLLRHYLRIKAKSKR